MFTPLHTTAALFVLGFSSPVRASGEAPSSAAFKEIVVGDWLTPDLQSLPTAAGDVDGDGYGDLLYVAQTEESGEVCLFRGAADGLPSRLPVLLQRWPGAFSVRAASAGDVNGDGYDDVVMSACGYETEGVRLFLGSAGGIDPEGGTELVLDSAVSASGCVVHVAGVGDVNGDGYDDVAVGGMDFEPDGTMVGHVSLLPGGPTGLGAPLDTQHFRTPRTELPEPSGAGDVDGDGFADLLVAPGDGTAALWPGGPDGWNPDRAVELHHSDALDDRLWVRSARGAGDVNGDGYDDVVVGAADNGDEAGVAVLFYGSPAGLRSPDGPADTVVSGEPGSDFGTSVAGVGDVDADGYDDVVVGAPWHDVGANSGVVAVFSGAPDGLRELPQVVTPQSGEPYYWFGQGVAAAGDIDGDGHADFVTSNSAWRDRILLFTHCAEAGGCLPAGTAEAAGCSASGTPAHWRGLLSLLALLTLLVAGGRSRPCPA